MLMFVAMTGEIVRDSDRDSQLKRSLRLIFPEKLISKEITEIQLKLFW